MNEIEVQENERKYKERGKSLTLEGMEYIYPEREEDWKASVQYAIGNGEEGVKVVASALEVMKELEAGKKIEEVASAFETGLQSTYLNNYNFVIRNFILDYSKRGPEFEEYYLSQHPESNSPLREYKIDEIKTKNVEYERRYVQYISQGKIPREEEERNIEKNRGMKKALEGRIQEIDRQITNEKAKDSGNKEVE